jgi:hypothetical protein
MIENVDAALAPYKILANRQMVAKKYKLFFLAHKGGGGLRYPIIQGLSQKFPF